MQRLAPSRAPVYFDPVQRAEQWKQVVSKEEKSLGLSARSRVERPPKAPKRGADGSTQPGMGRSGGMYSSRSELRSSRGGGAPRHHGGAPVVPGLRRNEFALNSARSSLSYRSQRTGRSHRSRRSGRSTSRSSRSGMSTSRSGYSLTSSLPSSASGMTSVALERLEKLEKSLDAERHQRQQAEEQLEKLRRLVDERLMKLEGTN